MSWSECFVEWSITAESLEILLVPLPLLHLLLLLLSESSLVLSDVSLASFLELLVLLHLN